MQSKVIIQNLDFVPYFCVDCFQFWVDCFKVRNIEFLQPHYQNYRFETPWEDRKRTMDYDYSISDFSISSYVIPEYDQRSKIWKIMRNSAGRGWRSPLGRNQSSWEANEWCTTYVYGKPPWKPFPSYIRGVTNMLDHIIFIQEPVILSFSKNRRLKPCSH